MYLFNLTFIKSAIEQVQVDLALKKDNSHSFPSRYLKTPMIDNIHIKCSYSTTIKLQITNNLSKFKP